VIDLHPFQYERTLESPRAAIVQVVPDGAMWAHARRGFGDLRIVDADGNQVPWRFPPRQPDDAERELQVLDSGRRDGLAVARVRTPAPVDRITLDIPDARFVGVATVYGNGTKLATEQIYSLHGARPARSTTVLLPPNDLHVLEIRATSVTRINGARVHFGRAKTALVRVPARVRFDGTTAVIDVGHADVPVDELRISATTARYNRPFTVWAHGGVTTTGRLVRSGGPGLTVVPLAAAGRFLRVRIANGDDPPLRGVHISAWAQPRPLLVEGGHRGPLKLYYGSAATPAPDYEFARLPLRGTRRNATLGPEHANLAFHVRDERSVFARHRSLVLAALALAAALLVAAGGLALRRT
jgi:hypothetical protein